MQFHILFLVKLKLFIIQCVNLWVDENFHLLFKLGIKNNINDVGECKLPLFSQKLGIKTRYFWFFIISNYYFNMHTDLNPNSTFFHFIAVCIQSPKLYVCQNVCQGTPAVKLYWFAVFASGAMRTQDHFVVLHYFAVF